MLTTKIKPRIINSQIERNLRHQRQNPYAQRIERPVPGVPESLHQQKCKNRKRQSPRIAADLPH